MSIPRQISFVRAAGLRTHALQLVLNVAILVAWLWLFRAMFDYLGVIVAREDFRTNQIVLLGVVALVVYQIKRGQWRLQIHVAPRPHPLPLALTLSASIAYLAVERWLDINTVSAVLFGIATYGLLGLWLAPASWRQGLPAALLLIGVLPFGEHMQTFLGYPMRIATAEIVRQGLTFFHIGSTSIDTILILENGVAQIDLPCSGVKSLWTGALFFLAATWLDRRALSWRWFGVAFFFAALLFLANLLRVAALVVSAQIFNLPLLAQLLHVPLGVLGFVGACAAAFALLRFCKPIAPAPHNIQSFTQNAHTQWLNAFLVVSIFIMGFLYTQRPQTGLSVQAPLWHFPAALKTTALPLKPDEVAWLTRDGADSATRFRFSYQGISGSMIFVPSQTWRAHHYPERCFQVYGLNLDESHAQLVTENFPVRAVTLRDAKTNARLNAAYWFQAATRATDDYAARIWADTAGPPERWVLISILFDKAVEPADPRVVALYQELRHVVASSFNPGQP